MLFPDGITRYCFVFYDAKFPQNFVANDPNNKITCWYTNYRTATNPTSTNFNIFLEAGPPSAPGAPSTGGTQTSSIAGISLPSTVTAPTYADGLNSFTGPPPSIQSYQMVVSSPGDSTRYGGAVAYSNTFTSSTNSFTLSGLYPSSTYALFAKAKNNSTNTSYGPTGSTSSLATIALAMPSNTGSFSYSPSPTYTAKLVGSNVYDASNASVSPVLLTSQTTLTSSSFTNPIHTQSNRGSTGTSLLTVKADLVNDSATVSTLTATYNGFNAAVPTATDTYMTINTNTWDGYSLAALRGYYLTSANTVLLKSTAFNSSNNRNYVNVAVTQTGQTSNNSSTYFYYDLYSGPPTFNSSAITLRTTTNRQICGIYVIYGSVGLNTTTSVNKIGTSFYNSTQILSYSSGQTETDPSRSNKGAAAKSFTDPVVFTNTTSVVQPAVASFATSTTLTTTAYGPTNASASTTSNSIFMILDTATNTLVTSSAYPATILTIGLASSQFGFRINSGSVSAGPPFTTALPPASVAATTAYDNSVSLVSNQDLQICAGFYQTKTGNANGYLNYGTYYLNTLDYSGISATGYRFATFSFKAAQNTSPFTFIQFKLNGVQQSITFPASDVTKPTVGSTRLYFYYRVEDGNASTNFGAAYRNTTWLDATNTSAPLLNSSTYFDTTKVLSAANSSTPNTFASQTYTINCSCNSLTVGASDNIYVYFRISVPMNETFAFSSVSCQFTSS